MLDQLRLKLQNFNINTFLASVVSTVASATTEDYMSFVYFLIAVSTQMLTVYFALKKNANESSMQGIELELKREDLRSKRIDNDKKEKDVLHVVVSVEGQKP